MTGERRCLPGGQLCRGNAEELLRGGFDPVGPVTEVHLVEVALQDLLLGQLAFQRHREGDLGQLALDRDVIAHLALGQLLGDGGPALGDAAVLHRDEQRPAEALDVVALVLPEATVLCGDDRVLHVGGDLVQRQDRPVDLVVQHGEDGAVGGVDGGGLVQTCQLDVRRHLHPEADAVGHAGGCRCQQEGGDPAEDQEPGGEAEEQPRGAQ